MKKMKTVFVGMRKLIVSLANHHLGDIPDPLPYKMRVAFFAVTGGIMGIYWLVFFGFAPEKSEINNTAIWFIIGAFLPFVCMWFGLIRRSIAWSILLCGYLALGWFGLTDRHTFAQSMMIAFLLYLFLGLLGWLLSVMLNKHCCWDIPTYCRKLRRCIDKNAPPPTDIVDNCTYILGNLWDEVRNMPDDINRAELLLNLQKLIDKVESYKYREDIDSFFNEPELTRFKWWHDAAAETEAKK